MRRRAISIPYLSSQSPYTTFQPIFALILKLSPNDGNSNLRTLTKFYNPCDPLCRNELVNLSRGVNPENVQMFISYSCIFLPVVILL